MWDVIDAENRRYANFSTHRLGIGKLRYTRKPAGIPSHNANGQTDVVDLAAEIVVSLCCRLPTATHHGDEGLGLEPDPIAMPDPIPAPSNAAVVRRG